MQKGGDARGGGRGTPRDAAGRRGFNSVLGADFRVFFSSFLVFFVLGMFWHQLGASIFLEFSRVFSSLEFFGANLVASRLRHGPR